MRAFTIYWGEEVKENPPSHYNQGKTGKPHKTNNKTKGTNKMKVYKNSKRVYFYNLRFKIRSAFTPES